MVKPKSRKTNTRKAARRPTKRKTVRRKMARNSSDSPKQVAAKNRKAQWNVYREIQKKSDDAWDKLRMDVHRKADPQILLDDKNNLLLLLGECNYLAGECLRIKYTQRD